MLGENKRKYIELCDNEESIPLFSKYWWLDAVCGENNWDVILSEKGDTIIGSLPYYKKKVKKKFNILTLPHQTQTLGPWIRNSKDASKKSSKISNEIKVMEDLIQKLPQFDYFIQHFHYSITNWLPFYWAGFQCTTKYTYVIPDISDSDKVLASFSYDKRKSIKDAKGKISVKLDEDYKEFYQFHKKCLKQLGQEISYSEELFYSIYKASKERNMGCIMSAYDEEGNKHTSLFLIWDRNSAYHLISAINPEFRQSNSFSCLVFESIKFLGDKTKSYDFEGSMIKNVESAFRLYGTEQKAYFEVSKTNSSLLKLFLFLSGRNV
ncbi:methicillin resistance protein (plasmid) [Chryseobacterium panacisoli]|uniref:Methicillin resistance protein n=1 Tax=Chryseobacterium panacisoli TaxID=1807141 RepID=A0A5D9A1H5_9FLAO|nr:methicillin resistance protein [Chryseobacterium panacisoli]TZF99764.1 methicillin resistance protein [Chryseobacterium panacisoli]